MNRREFLRAGVVTLLGWGFSCTKENPKEENSEGLFRVSQGVYAVNPDLITKNHAAVLVHPYFIPSHRNPSYFKNLDRFLAEYEGVLVTLEEYTKLSPTARIISSYREGATVLVPTRIEDSTPHETNWAGLVNYLRGFNRYPIKLLGGYYEGCGYGCLGYTEEKLGESALETVVLEELTFSRSALPKVNGCLSL
jgi:hypothetical protein